MTDAAGPVRRSTWQKLDTAALDTRLVLLDAPSAAEPERPHVSWVVWSLFVTSVAGSIITACMWAGLIR
jgi:hypothetical protein